MKKLIIISLFFLNFLNISFSQSDSLQELPILYNPEFYPTYPGGELKLYELIEKNLRYPESEKLYGVYGTVYVQFIVEKDGSLSDFEVKKSPHELLSEEALRVCSLLPKKWKPGGYFTSSGKVYKECRMVLPIKFENEIHIRCNFLLPNFTLISWWGFCSN